MSCTREWGLAASLPVRTKAEPRGSEKSGEARHILTHIQGRGEAGVGTPSCQRGPTLEPPDLTLIICGEDT